eukprot:120731-Rhodomonas_salina.2
MPAGSSQSALPPSLRALRLGAKSLNTAAGSSVRRLRRTSNTRSTMPAKTAGCSEARLRSTSARWVHRACASPTRCSAPAPATNKQPQQDPSTTTASSTAAAASCVWQWSCGSGHAGL